MQGGTRPPLGPRSPGMQRSWLLAISVCLCLGAGACQPHGRGTEAIYTGDTDPMEKVVGTINENNRKIPTLWARHYYEANIVDEQKKSHFVNGDGVLLYASPSSMRIVGTKELIGTVFEIGSNDTTFWLKVVPDVDTLWFGSYQNMTEEALARAHIPIRPDMVLQVLGVNTIDTNFNNLPAPTMRFNNDQRMYMFVWNAHFPDRWVAQREVWYDLKQKLPRFVFLFDSNGRVVLRAQLGKHQQLEAPDLPREQWPWVATDYRLFFPDSRSTMRLMLSDVHLHSPDSRRVPVPNPRSFVPPDPKNAGVSHVIEIR